MEASVRPHLPALIEELLADAPRYDFFRAVRLVEELFPEGERSGRLPAGVRLRPAAEISFPGGDIRRCRLDSKGRIELQLSFLGLYGVDAPVPHDLLEAAAGEEESAAPLRAFLDIFSARIYELLYFGWKKYRPVGAGEASLFEKYLDAFSGLGEEVGPEERLFAGPYGGRVRSAEALSGLLSEYLGTPVEVCSFRPRWITVAGRPALGGGDSLALGENVVLGERILDVTRRVEVRIGPLSPAEARDLFPGGSRSAVLYRLVWRYLPPAVDFELCLLVRSEGGPPLVLGKEEIGLGWDSHLGEDRSGIREIPLPASSLRGTAAAAGREEE